MCKELNRLWSEQVGEVVLSIWISLILRHAVKNTTQVTMKHIESVECRKSGAGSASGVSCLCTFALSPELYRSRCRTYTLSSHVPNSDNSHFAKGGHGMDLSIAGK